MPVNPHQPIEAIKSAPQPSFSGVTSAWFRLAAHPATVRRALITAAFVGVVLIAINHGPAILNGEVTRARIAQMCLTVLVPYLVSTVSSVATRRELSRTAKNTDKLQ